MSVALLQEAINYMEDHMLEDITYVDAARSVRMSGYSFHRVFSFTVGMTANEYIRARRLSLAGQELQDTDISVIEAACKYGYESPESFSRAFSRFHGSTPRQAKRKGAELRLFDPLVIKITIGGGSIMEYRIEHRESQRFIAVKRAFSNETGLDGNSRSIPDFWAECTEKRLLEAMKAMCAPGRRDLYGLCSSVKDSQTSFFYGIGVKAEECAGYSAELEVWETGPADYAVFRCKGPDGECIGGAWERFFKEFCPQTGYTQTDETDYEIYFENSGPGLFCELWVPVAKG